MDQGCKSGFFMGGGGGGGGLLVKFYKNLLSHEFGGMIFKISENLF